VQLRDWRSGRRIARVPLGFGTVLRWGFPYWQFHRVDLLDLLAEEAVAAGVHLHTGKQMEQLRTEGDNVRLEFSDGTFHRTSCLVGADGVRSALRSQLFGSAGARFTGHVAWRAMLPADTLAVPHPTATLIHLGPGRHVVSYKVDDAMQINMVAVEERKDWVEESWSRSGDPWQMRRAFSGWAEPVRTMMAACHKAYLWGLFDHEPLESWSKGPVVLLGDAAHPMLPFMAQGATMAIEDAFVLARHLAEAGDVASAFAGFEADRKPRTTRVQRQSAQNASMYHLRNPALRLAADLGLASVSHSFPGLFLRRLNWLYGADVTR
jgi:salicylate hydroxylase